MIRLMISFVLIQVAVSEDFPEECKRPPPYVEKPMECCNIPEFFSKDELESCDFKKLAPASPPLPVIGHPIVPPPCDSQICLFKKKGLLKEDSSLDNEALTDYLEAYANANEAFRPAINKVKQLCVTNGLADIGPPQLCDPIKLVMCTSFVLFAECPKWEKARGCNALNEYVHRCKNFMFQGIYDPKDKAE